MAKIKDKKGLKELLRNEGYDKIVIWEDGTWANVGTGYGGEQDGNNPATSIDRVSNYNLTHKQISELVKRTEEEIN